MVKIYDSLYENGVTVNGRTKLFVREVDEDGTIGNHDYGIAFTPDSTGTLFIVDDWLIDQLDKVVFKDGTLKVKDGEELVEPVKSELELEEEELLKRIAEIQAQKNADTEDTTDEP